MQQINSEAVFLKIFRDVSQRGSFVSPRGQKVLEVENYCYEIPPFVRFQNFDCRKLNLNYIKYEFLWYLRGDKFDLSILKKAKIWQDIVNEDGSLNSNYGQYVFGKENQFDNVVRILKEDKDSRRACISFLNKEHLFSNTKDVPCTQTINFRIRNDKLNMSVHMRSQDLIYGMANDCPAFSFIHEMMLNVLKQYYPNLEYGMYHHICDSLHVYERHFKMLEQLVSGGANYITVDCPKISGADEVKFMRSMHEGNFTEIPEQFKFTQWLLA
jgi:thymidylate synthase